MAQLLALASTDGPRPLQAAIADTHRCRNGESRAGRITCQHNIGSRMTGEQPLVRLGGIFHGGRKRVLRRQSVIESVGGGLERLCHGDQYLPMRLRRSK